MTGIYIIMECERLRGIKVGAAAAAHSGPERDQRRLFKDTYEKQVSSSEGWNQNTGDA